MAPKAAGGGSTGHGKPEAAEGRMGRVVSLSVPLGKEELFYNQFPSGLWDSTAVLGMFALN